MTDGAGAAGRETSDRPVADAFELKGTAYELFILLLSVLSIVNTVIVLFPQNGPVQQVAFVTDVTLVPVFLFDFLYRLRTTRSKTRYFRHAYGWADFIAIVPMLRVFRMFRVVRVVGLLRRQGGQRILEDVDRNRANTTFLFTVFLVLAVVEFAGMGVFLVENADPAANIHSASDAIWWGYVTVTTVGYGDQYPVTTAGRIIGTFLLFAGIALFSVLTGFIANAFLSPRRRRVGPGLPPNSVEADLADLRQMLQEQETRSAAIRAKLGDVERAIGRKGSGG